MFLTDRGELVYRIYYLCSTLSDIAMCCFRDLSGKKINNIFSINTGLYFYLFVSVFLCDFSTTLHHKPANWFRGEIQSGSFLHLCTQGVGHTII
jgi:hypothetical protein